MNLCWTKAHADDLGNVIAETLANEGCTVEISSAASVSSVRICRQNSSLCLSEGSVTFSTFLHLCFHVCIRSFFQFASTVGD